MADTWSLGNGQTFTNQSDFEAAEEALKNQQATAVTPTPTNPIPGYTPPATKTAATNPIPGYTPNAQAQAALSSVQPTKAPTATPAVQPTAQPTPTSQQNLTYYGSGTQQAIAAANAAIAQLGQVYNQAMASGNTAQAQAAHTQANQIRQAMGQQAGMNYNPTTGAPITQPTAQPGAPTTPTQQPLATGITANKQTPGFNTSDGAFFPDYQSAVAHQNQITPTTTSPQTSADSVLQQMSTLVQQMNNYNPQSDPEYQTMVNAATQSVMESMNSRGILNSTVTSDQVTQALAPVISDLTNAAYSRFQTQLSGLNDLYSSYAGQAQQQTANQLAQQQLDLTKQQDDVTNALDTIKSLGYVDNQSSIILGIPVNTSTSDALQFAQSELDKINIAQADNQEKLQAAQMNDQTKMAQVGVEGETAAASMANANTNAEKLNYEIQTAPPTTAQQNTIQANVINIANKLLTTGLPNASGNLTGPMSLAQIQQWAYQNAQYLATHQNTTPQELVSAAQQVQSAKQGAQIPLWQQAATRIENVWNKIV